MLLNHLLETQEVCQMPPSACYLYAWLINKELNAYVKGVEFKGVKIGVRDLSSECQMSINTVRDAVKSLLECGLITQEIGSGTQKNTYHVCNSVSFFDTLRQSLNSTVSKTDTPTDTQADTLRQSLNSTVSKSDTLSNRQNLTVSKTDTPTDTQADTQADTVAPYSNNSNNKYSINTIADTLPEVLSFFATDNFIQEVTTEGTVIDEVAARALVADFLRMNRKKHDEADKAERHFWNWLRKLKQDYIDKTVGTYRKGIAKDLTKFWADIISQVKLSHDSPMCAAFRVVSFDGNKLIVNPNTDSEIDKFENSEELATFFKVLRSKVPGVKLEYKIPAPPRTYAPEQVSQKPQTLQKPTVASLNAESETFRNELDIVFSKLVNK
jgi:predicted transcriptional regulator